MGFLTQLDRASHPVVQKLICQHIVSGNVKSLLKQVGSFLILGLNERLKYQIVSCFVFGFVFFAKLISNYKSQFHKILT